MRYIRACDVKPARCRNVKIDVREDAVFASQRPIVIVIYRSNSVPGASPRSIRASVINDGLPALSWTQRSRSIQQDRRHAIEVTITCRETNRMSGRNVGRRSGWDRAAQTRSASAQNRDVFRFDVPQAGSDHICRPAKVFT